VVHIAITTYGRDENSRYSLPVEYVDSVERAGGIPLLIPPGKPAVASLLEQVDGLILTGGGDISPSVYDGDTHEALYMVDSSRDDLEMELTRKAIASKLPTLGICRGMQIINVALGGTLIEHLPDVVGDAVAHRAPPREPVPHPVHLKPGSRLEKILMQAEHNPPSWHHQGIRDLAVKLEVVASAADGTIEAVEMPEHPWLLAVQWHPELTAATEPADQRLFDAFVQAAQKHREERNAGE
jgi:putative glutamine amidotransferase